MRLLLDTNILLRLTDPGHTSFETAKQAIELLQSQGYELRTVPANLYPPNKKVKQKQGLTLIELSIVLVIIGLIVGGVLVGQDLIKAAELRSEMSQIEKFNVAVNTFKLKYNCLPGDCTNATQYFDASSQPEKVSNGNGNKRIDRGIHTNGSMFSWVWGSMEWKYVFDHLAAAGLTELPQYDETDLTNNRAGYGYPRCKLTKPGVWNAGPITIAGGGDCGVILSYEFTGHFFRIGAHGDKTTYNYTAFWAGYSPNIARQFDTKFDDGLPLSGAIQAAAISYQSALPGTCTANNTSTEGADLTTCASYGVSWVNASCTNAGMTDYNTLNADYQKCSLRIKAQF